MPLIIDRKAEVALSDIELIARYRESRDVAYPGVLFQRYAHLVLGICLKYLKNEEDSKDAAMELFENLTEMLVKHEITNFKSWLHTTTKNHCLMKLRKPEAKAIRRNLEGVDESLFMENPESEHLIVEEMRDLQIRHLGTALPRLNEEQRVCIELFYLQGKSYQEVAETTGYSLNQVKSHIQNGKRNLKNFLTNVKE